MVRIVYRRRIERAGFTIVELLIVIVVIAILAAISIVAYDGISARARDTVKLAEINQFTKQLELYKVKHGEYPAPSPSGSPFATDNRRRDFVEHVNSEPDNYRQKRELFESTYDITIPEGVLYYKTTYNPTYPMALDVVYVMATFYNNDDIPEANKSNRLKTDSQNGVWPQLVLYAEKPCTLPINKLSPNVPASRSFLGSGWGLLVDGAIPTNNYGMKYVSNARESATASTSTAFYTVAGHEDCGQVTYLEDWTTGYEQIHSNKRKAAVGLFVLQQGER